MSGHLCLKWNNHSSAFLKSISNIQIKERFCDATIACQGKYFPVHRIVLSTCSDYFDEIFERMQSQHPYIVFKDIEPREMELLLNYMYQGEVNVLQANLPTLIKAAEALKVKGLAVPDDLPSTKESSSSKKRSSTNSDTPQSKRRYEERRRRRSNSFESATQPEVSEAEEVHAVASAPEGERSRRQMTHEMDSNETKIKEEPLDISDYGEQPHPSDAGTSGFATSNSSLPIHSESTNKTENVFVNFPITEESETYIKTENPVPPDDSFDDQSSSWSDFASANPMQDLPLPETSRQEGTRYMPESLRESPLESSLAPYSFWSSLDNDLIKDEGNSYGNVDYADQDPTKLIFKCPSCHYRSVSKGCLDVHQRIHTGEKPFECKLCLTKFRQKIHLQRHQTKKKTCFKGLKRRDPKFQMQ